jgi:hypothetical protein
MNSFLVESESSIASYRSIPPVTPNEIRPPKEARRYRRRVSQRISATLSAAEKDMLRLCRQLSQQGAARLSPSEEMQPDPKIFADWFGIGKISRP